MYQPLFSLPVSLEIYQSFSNFLHDEGFDGEMYTVVDAAIAAWMNQAQEAKGKARATLLEGYQWKDVFLPSGTTLRTVSKGVSYLAHVNGSELHFDGKRTTPAQFANVVAGTCRSAWKTVWLKFPEQDEWQQALALRKKTGQKMLIND